MATATKPLTRIHVLRAGRFTDATGRDVTITLADLDELVSTYDPKRHEAPVVVGHPKTDAPAYGWTRGLKREGENVYALTELTEPFADVVKGQHYKKVSSSFYLPGSVGNPTPGKRYLKHIGFLGAQPPAIKGLESISLAADAEDGAVSVELGEAETQVANLLGKVRTWLTDKFGQADADAALPEADIAALAAMSSSTPAAAPALAEPAPAAAATPPPATPPATRFAVGATVRTTGAKQGKVVLERGEFVQLLMDGESEPRWFPATDVAAASTEQQAPVQAGNAPASAPASLAETELRAREARVVLAERRVGRERTLAWLDSLVREGRPLPASREDIVSLFEALDSAQAVVTFAEPGVKTPSDLLRSMLARSPRQVEFAEVSAGGGPERAPADSRALARRAERLQAEAAKRGAPLTDVEAVHAAIQGE